ncbi:D-2-hydroxyacid dehydrogenase [Alkalicoccus luteus]|uniref:D-2-hydroxyacid dehydrogenase n=1 Tax=Alkalicoccus luteus TaxID=1237094 RepID=A0A969PP40_9BACI|nr:D-2-hydroxyacid dehydrogenase [Alkalicoccus luteus]NJP37790.1 D-2-hydroxyacid dehydrogenase [Alkalicoccus luteus]
MKIVSSGNIHLDITLNLEKRFNEHDFCWHENMSQAEADLKDADVFITYGEDMEPHHIETASRLKWIMIVSAGMDEMPFQEVAAKNILVTNAKGIHAVPMAEYSMHMMLHTARKTPVVQAQEKEHRWSREPVMNELYGASLLIAGAGAIGSRTAELAKAFGMHVTGINRSGGESPYFDRLLDVSRLPEALEDADYVISILPKTEETTNFFSMDQFRQMKQSGVFINIGRGNAVHEQDIITALDEGEFSHACLDVFNEEPLPEDHPFWAHPSITVTPHLSGISPMYQPRAMEIFEKNLTVFLSGKGEYINQVDPVRGY